MADAAEVWARVRRAPRVAYSALVPNRRGAEAAVEAGGFASLQAFVAASDGYNTANVGKTVEESLEDVADVIARGLRAGVPVEVACPRRSATRTRATSPPRASQTWSRGSLDARRVRHLARRHDRDGDADARLGHGRAASTSGSAGPALNLHLHDTRGTAMANVLAALQMGVTEFDASVGGLGGSPFAPGARTATSPPRNIVAVLEEKGVHTGVDSVALAEASTLAGALVGRPLP